MSVLTSRALRCPVLWQIQAVVTERPRATAVVGPESAMDYGEMWERSLWWEDGIRRLRLPADAIVAILSAGSADLLPAFLGVRLAGMVPLLIDTSAPSAQCEAMLEHCRPGAVIELDRGTPPRRGRDDARVLNQAAGYVVFTSGAQAQGVVGDAEGLAHFLAWEAGTLGLGGDSRVAALASPASDAVLRELLLAAWVGGELHVPGPSVRTDPARVLGWLADSRADVAHLVPGLSSRWVAASPEARLDALRWAVFAGEPLYSRQVRQWRAVAPKCQVLNLYGPAETTLAKFWHRVDEARHPGLQPVGRALPGTVLHAVGLDGPDCEAGGEFRVRIETRHGSLGYLDAESDKSAHAALTRRLGTTLFTTQDRGRMSADGELVVDGRLDLLAKRRGVLLDVSRIEAEAMGEPGVRAACCVQVDAEAEGDVVLVVEAETPLSDAALGEGLQRTLGTQMPDEIVVLSDLPLLTDGKVDRQRLVRMLESRSSSETPCDIGVDISEAPSAPEQ